MYYKRNLRILSLISRSVFSVFIHLLFYTFSSNIRGTYSIQHLKMKFQMLDE